MRTRTKILILGGLALASAAISIMKRRKNAAYKSPEVDTQFDIEKLRDDAYSDIARWKSIVPKGVAKGKNIDGFQKRTVEMIGTNDSVFIFDEPGLRKTASSLTGVLNALGTDCRILVLCPKSVMDNWKTDAIEWTVLEDKDIAVIDKPSDLSFADETLVIINYDKMVRDYKYNKYISRLREINWDCIILDESQKTKIRDEATASKRSKNIKRFVDEKKIKKRIALTATPYVNNNREIVSMIDIVKPDLLTDDEKKVFSKNRESITNQLFHRLIPYTLYREHDIVFGDKAITKKSQDIDIWLSDEDANEYLTKIQSGYWDDLAKVFRWLISKKIPYIPAVLERPELANQKVVIFTQYTTQVHDDVAKYLKSYGYDVWVNNSDQHILPDGKNTTQENVLDSFANAKNGVIIASYGTLREGVNKLGSAAGMIFINLPYTYMELFQAQGRITRGNILNLNGDVTKYYYTMSAKMRGVEKVKDMTLDEKLARRIDSKKVYHTITLKGYSPKRDTKQSTQKLLMDYKKVLSGELKGKEIDNFNTQVNKAFMAIATASKAGDFKECNRIASEMVKVFGDELFTRYHDYPSTIKSYKAIKEAIAGKGYNTFLDVGCFDGYMSQYLGIKCVGIDICAPWEAAFKKYSYPGSAFLTWEMLDGESIREMVFESLGQEPDCVIMCRSLHHLSDDDKERLKEAFDKLPIYIWDEYGGKEKLKEGWW